MAVLFKIKLKLIRHENDNEVIKHLKGEARKLQTAKLIFAHMRGHYATNQLCYKGNYQGDECPAIHAERGSNSREKPVDNSNYRRVTKAY